MLRRLKWLPLALLDFLLGFHPLPQSIQTQSWLPLPWCLTHTHLFLPQHRLVCLEKTYRPVSRRPCRRSDKRASCDPSATESFLRGSVLPVSHAGSEAVLYLTWLFNHNRANLYHPLSLSGLVHTNRFSVENAYFSLFLSWLRESGYEYAVFML